MAFEINFMGSAAREFKDLRVYDQLVHEPTAPSKNRKCLRDVTPTFEHVPPLWELRVGEFRVFYDVDLTEQRVVVRAIRRNGHGQTTEDIT